MSINIAAPCQYFRRHGVWYGIALYHALSYNQQIGTRKEEVSMSAFIDIKSVTGSDYRAVKQDLKFRTGKFLWRVVFNIALNPATVNNQNLTVYNSNNKPVDTVISYNAELNSIEIEPKEAYAAGETYTLNVSTNVESRGGQRLKNEINIEFMV